MSHEIEAVRLSDGRLAHEALYANSPAWHGLGEVWRPGEGLAPCSQEIEEILPSIFFKVEKRPVCDTDGNADDGWYRLVRTDTGKLLHVVGDKYEPLQNREGFEFLDSLHMDGVIRYESVFVLNGGKSVVLLARMPSYDEVVPGDVSFRYVMAKLQHGGGSTILTPTSVRAVCANTVRAALEGNTNQIAIRHSGDMKLKLDAAKDAISQFDRQFTLFRENAQKLLVGYDKERAADYMEELYPTPVEETYSTERGYNRAKNAHDRKVGELRYMFKQPGQQMKGVKGTWWALFNSVTEAIDHGKRRTVRGDKRATNENRYKSVIENDGAAFKERAFQLALEMVA